MNVLIAGKYNLKVRIGNGSFGDIFMGKINDSCEDVAIKLEKNGSKHPHLEQECKVLKQLNCSDAKRMVGIPKLIWYGTEGDYKVMVTELLGPNLEEIFTMCHRKLSLDTILKLTIQIVERIEYLHSVRYIHKDIKPENILIGVGKNCSSLYIIDFGLSKKYVDKNGSHIEFQDNLPFVGTDMFSSISALRGKEQSRRDDLESVLYMSLYFLLGGLPWSSASGEQNYAKISCMKEEFIKSKNVTIPSIYFDLFAYVRGLAFNEKPSYAHMIQVLKSKLTTTSPEFLFYVGQTKPLTEQKHKEEKKERSYQTK